MRSCGIGVVWVASALALTQTAQAQSDCLPLWERAWFAAPSSGYGTGNRFILQSVMQKGLHLTGECAYTQGENQKPAVAAIDGTDAKECGFWPDVTAEVRNEKTGVWERIANPFTRGHRSTVTVAPEETKYDLLVALDVFLPLVDKYKLGRLVLKNGAAAVFELDKLLEEEPRQNKP